MVLYVTWKRTLCGSSNQNHLPINASQVGKWYQVIAKLNKTVCHFCTLNIDQQLHSVAESGITIDKSKPQIFESLGVHLLQSNSF
jgi:hypothetical protein